MTTLPPLNALRAFEAVARHLSMTKAADELHVTHAAISQQIKLLEEYLHLQLLNRDGKRFKLTDQGQAYATALSAAFTNIKNATDQLLHQDDKNILTIRIPATLALRWLIPRLQTFQTAHPDIEVRISTSIKEINFQQEAIDLAIYYGDGNWPDLHTDFLYEDYIFPVCNPNLFKNEKKPDLSQAKFIYVTHPMREQDWPLWFKAANLPEPPKSSRLYFQDTLQALQAAQAGMGIAITHEPFVMDEIHAGQLIIPSDVKIKSTNNYYLVCPDSYLRKNKVRQFRTWLLKEALNNIP